MNFFSFSSQLLGFGFFFFSHCIMYKVIFYSLTESRFYISEVSFRLSPAKIEDGEQSDGSAWHKPTRRNLLILNK